MRLMYIHNRLIRHWVISIGLGLDFLYHWLWVVDARHDLNRRFVLIYSWLFYFRDLRWLSDTFWFINFGNDTNKLSVRADDLVLDAYLDSLISRLSCFFSKIFWDLLVSSRLKETISGLPKARCKAILKIALPNMLSSIIIFVLLSFEGKLQAGEVSWWHNSSACDELILEYSSKPFKLVTIVLSPDDFTRLDWALHGLAKSSWNLSF